MAEWESSKKKGILEAARNLFWKHGFKRVTVEEICEQAACSKMTFYKSFSNKKDLAKAVFDRAVAKGKEEFRLIMESQLAPAEKIKRIFMMKLEGTSEISNEFLNDFYKNPELGLKEHIQKTTQTAWEEMINDFRIAQEKGIIRKEFKPELIWYLAQKMMDMINDQNLLKIYSNPQEMIMDLTGFFLYGLSPAEKLK